MAAARPRPRWLVAFALGAAFAGGQARAQYEQAAEEAVPAPVVSVSVSGTSTATEIHQGLEGAVKAEMEATAQSAVTDTFTRLAVPAPLKIEATADADFDLTPVAPHLTAVRVTVRVHLSEGRPGDEMRQARTALATRLRAKGWRVDGKGDEASPNVTLVIEPVLADPALALPSDKRPYFVLGALAIGTLSALILAFWMLARGMRALRKPRRGTSIPKDETDAQELPRLVQSMATASGPGLDVLPQIGLTATTRPTSAEPKMPVIDVPSALAGAVAGPATSTPVAEDYASALRRKISAMPLDKAIEALAALDPRTRRHIIGTLDLKEPVRRRLERELN